MRSLSFYRLLAESDKNLFFQEIQKLGFIIEGRTNNDPLNKRVEEARVLAISKEISEDRDDNNELPSELKAIQELAEVLGYIVSYESAPPGFSGTVKAMKKHAEIDNPFALAQYMYKKGDKPHIKPEKGKPRYKKPK